VPDGDLVWTKGADKVKSVPSSSFGHRDFCGECGTPFLMKVDHQPETVDFSVATLDEPGQVAPGLHIFWASRVPWFDPGAIAPGFHIFWGSKVPWFDPGDDLPKFDKFRPDTRGLEGTEPPA
jgi:hypothetical protein